ncbi:MAG: hypothetical protein GX595_18220, partial [Lentisphaerae bacterium]|nr:hypothetical protein [Lentisphaerota bacterium]
MTLALSPHTVLHGFRILRVEAIEELDGLAVEARHERSGARLLSLANTDPENLFAVGVPSPPSDACGTPHILEHAVLAGSRRFPVKDPFVEMLKSSLATFINAFTCDDRTLYPVASTVPQDFFNLVEVYLDAVFQPLLSPDTLRREGWHWSVVTTPSGRRRLEPNGVVFNEMRGAFSDLDTILHRDSMARLFPRGTYRFDAGGEPHAIPTLTHEAFMDAYRRLYHPAGCRLFLYGSIPLADSLRFLDAHLPTAADAAAFTPPAVVRQPRWSRPRRAAISLGGRLGDDTAAAAAVGWMIGDLPDIETELAWQLIDLLLLGDDAAPLRRGLLESGLGADLIGSGYSSDALQTVFQVGLKGPRPIAGRRLEQIILDILRQTRDQGIDAERLQDGLRQLEYRHREIDTDFPLALMEDALSVWFYDYDPLPHLRLDAALLRLRQRLHDAPGLLSDLIDRDLLANPHRLTLSWRHRPGETPERERRLRQVIGTARRSLGAADLDRLEAEDRALEERQGQPDRPEALAALPRLHLKDLPDEPTPLRSQAETLPNGFVFLRHEVPTRGLNYVTMAFDLSGLPAALWPHVPAAAAFLTRLGTRRRHYADLATALTRLTGGCNAWCHLLGTGGQAGAARPFLVLQTRFLDATCAGALELITELVDEIDPAPGQRLRELVAQRHAGLLAGVVSQGSGLAAMQAAAHLGAHGHLANLWYGPAQLQLSRAVSHDLRGAMARSQEALAAIAAWLQQRGPAYVSFVGNDRSGEALRGWLGQRPARRPSDSTALAGESAVGAPSCQGLSHALEVAYCAACLPVPGFDSPAGPLLQLGAQILSYDLFWEEIRAKGGAYGAACSYAPRPGRLAMSSYSDPAPARTLRVFAGLDAAVAAAAWSAADIERAAIACARDDEAPLRPGQATATGLWRHVLGLTQERRRAWRQAQRQATPEAVRTAMLAALQAGSPARGTAILADRRRLQA